MLKILPYQEEDLSAHVKSNTRGIFICQKKAARKQIHPQKMVNQKT
jgi:hypothetical protein